jgi:hypothetical protein
MVDEFGFGSGVTPPATEQPAVVVKPKGPGKNVAEKQKRFDIRVDAQEGEPRDIKIGVNGKVYQIWRGVVVSVPEEVVEVLRNAIAARLVVMPLPDGTSRQEWQDQSAVPYSVIRGPY